MKTLLIQDKQIGIGKPKIIVPIVEKTEEQIVAKGAELALTHIDAVEWRADHYEDVCDLQAVLMTLRLLREKIPQKLLLFTFRTEMEGGAKSVSAEYYTQLNEAVAKSKLVDLVDVEVFLGEETASLNIRNVQAAGVFVVGSNHDFEKTPDKPELLSRLKKMQDMGADIAKIAVMPNSPEDVLILLSATQEMHRSFAKVPLITMSMGPLGVISRLSGEVFGSCMTFGASGEVSAPGQIPVEELSCALDIINRSL